MADNSFARKTMTLAIEAVVERRLHSSMDDGWMRF
jgi:hypothetical protein